ncbi:MAG TPA: redoxin domain-containing protein [Casimicrobiaceae bacterium]|nr:redoxin domain-containing protein [Casimicrobiaceae bacterium]
MKAIGFAMMMLAMLALGDIKSASALELGKAAPDFTLEDTAGQKVSLSQFRGQKLVLIEFIGAVFAPTCSANVHERGLDYQKFKDLNVQIIGISSENRFALKAFSDSVKTPFPLLSDRYLEAIKSYGVLAPDKVRALRAYFLVDQKGILREQWLLGLPGDDMVFASAPIFAAIQKINGRS